MRKPRVLFLCVHNAGRSQMAAAFARALGGDAIDVLSAGSAPAATLNPVVVQAMREVGIDLARARPRLLDPADVAACDVVVTMGCGDSCPVLPAKRYEDWRVEDPAGLPLAAVRAIRDDLHDRVRGLLASMLGGRDSA